MTAEIPLNDAFRSALRAGVERDLARTRRRRSRGVRGIALACCAVAAALVLVLAQPFDHGQSAIARARAAVDVLPRTGILHEVTRGPDGALAEEVWQSLSNPTEHRLWQSEPTGGPEETSVADGVWMRFDAAANTVYTQRVIESTGAFSETENVPDLRRQLANPRIRDLGVETLAGRAVRHLELPGAEGTGDGTCEYYADASTLLPRRLACALDGRPTFVTTYDFVADDAANRANFALTSVHPQAAVKQDPNGIPGAAGDDLAAVTAAGVVDVTAGKAILQETDKTAMRAARALEASLGQDEIACFTKHGAAIETNAYGESTFHDPTGTVSAICGHFGDSRRAVGGTPAGAALRDREIAQATAIAACVKQRSPSQAQQAGVFEQCRREHPDAFLAGLPKVP